MTLDALRLEVAEISEQNADSLTDLSLQLAQAREMPIESALSSITRLLHRHNRSPMTLLERQRALQSFSDAFRHYSSQNSSQTRLGQAFIQLCEELATGFKRLLLQILQSKHPSRPHLAWCLYMTLQFLAQKMLRNHQLYQEPHPNLWRDSHIIYWLGEHQQCLDDPIAAAFVPTPADTLRGLYQQMLLAALSNPFHLAENQCLELFSALAPLAQHAVLLPWEREDEPSGPTIDLTESQPYLTLTQTPEGSVEYLRRFELGALLIALQEPSPLQSSKEHALLQEVQQHWLGRQQRRHQRLEHEQTCHLVAGLQAIHAQLLEQRPLKIPGLIQDASPGGARLLCSAEQKTKISVGQLVILLTDSVIPTLALVRWRHINAEGMHFGLRYLKGLPKPIWLRRTPSAQTHPGILQSTPAQDSAWHHGLWLPTGQFVEGENVWLQMNNMHHQKILPLPTANLETVCVTRYPVVL
ncbi:PilZ domain-containing protein [Pseudomonas sp. MS19]|uniref:PilZ domain-containing protein n=1 Tax=Pseudomonas sp. MS19 TaxID=2579939 RepID=UPI001562CCD9|nr:PilZ domain-containing protein [Pseudomonas sp. MS19]NRH26545.1 PilZ domain-containing protein [Pseudomonas sp. MS19]